MVQAAGLDLNENFIGGGNWVWNIAKFKCPRRAVRDQLDGLHGPIESRARRRRKCAMSYGVSPTCSLRFAVKVPLQIRTFVRFVAVSKLVVTPLVSVTVENGPVATAFVSVEVLLVADVTKLVSATEFVAEKRLVAGRLFTGVPIVKTLLEVVVVVLAVLLMFGAVMRLLVAAKRLLVRMEAVLVSVLTVAFVVPATPTAVPSTVLVTGTVTTFVVTTFVVMVFVVTIFVGMEKPALALPAATAWTAAISALKPLVVAVPLVSKLTLVEPSAMSPVSTNCTLPLMLALPLLLLLRIF
jgi:hypothetical protein